MSVFKKVRLQLFKSYNPGTVLWKTFYPWRHFKFKTDLIRTFGYLFSRDIQYFGEFGYELIAVVPYAYWLHKRNKLNATKSFKDTQCLYYFSENHIEMNRNRRHWLLDDFPLGNIHVTQLDTSQWYPPPYKRHYANERFKWEKPSCVICNKYTIEWKGPPINFLSLETLSKLFKILKEKYKIIYNRPTSKNIVSDDQEELILRDMEFIEKEHPEIITIQDLAENNKDLSFNELQMMVYANCDRFISVQGGSSILTSYFGGKNIIFAKRGSELEHDSYKWYAKLSGSKIYHVDDYSRLLAVVEKEFLRP